MGEVHGSKAVLYVDDISGACQKVDSDVTSITFSRSKNNPESTTMGNTTIQRIDGLRDMTMDVTGLWQSGSSASNIGIVSVLDDLESGSLVSRIQYLPGGSQSGSPIYTASMRLNNYAQNSPIDGITTVNFSMSIGSGSVVSACAV
jgi:hypothetical protein